jgi:hypothetical protein
MNGPEDDDDVFGASVDEEDEDVIDVDGCDDETLQSKFKCPPGFFGANCIGAKKELSKKGKPMLTLTFALDGTEFSATKGGGFKPRDAQHDVGGKEFKRWCSLVPAALFSFAATAKAMGFVPQGETNKIRAKPSDFINRRCVVEMKDSDYNGKTYSGIDECYPHPDGWEE